MQVLFSKSLIYPPILETFQNSIYLHTYKCTLREIWFKFSAHGMTHVNAADLMCSQNGWSALSPGPLSRCIRSWWKKAYSSSLWKSTSLTTLVKYTKKNTSVGHVCMSPSGFWGPNSWKRFICVCLHWSEVHVFCVGLALSPKVVEAGIPNPAAVVLGASAEWRHQDSFPLSCLQRHRRGRTW